MTDEDARILEIALAQPPFSRLLGLEIVSASVDLVIARLEVTQALTNRNNTLHGGAVMAIADNLGGTATFLNLREGQGTATMESKTNFFRPVPLGDVLRAETRPLHRGRRTMVWQTSLTRQDGKEAALVTQTQMILRSAD